jgi:predicted acetyltransferase
VEAAAADQHLACDVVGERGAEEEHGGSGFVGRSEAAQGALAFEGFQHGGLDAELTIKLTDTFRPQNAGEYNIEFRGGTARLADKKLAGMRIELDVSDLSSLFMGAVDIGSLYRLGRLIAREEDLPVLQRVFHAWQKPECVSGF